MTDLLSRLKCVCRSGEGWTARCPAHEDQHNSLSIHHRDGRWLVKCHAGCGWNQIINALGMDARDFFDDELGGGGGSIAERNRATAQPKSKSKTKSPEIAGAQASTLAPVCPEPGTLGLTLEQYAHTE